MKNYYTSFFTPKTRVLSGVVSLSLIIICYSLFYGNSRAEFTKTALFAFLLWIASTLLTDKYVHKYPQRYFTYTLAANFKAFALIVVFIVISIFLNLIGKGIAFDLLGIMTLFSVVEYLLSFPRVEQPPVDIAAQTDLFFEQTGSNVPAKNERSTPYESVNYSSIINNYGNTLPEWSLSLMQKHIGNDKSRNNQVNDIAIIEDFDDFESKPSRICKLSMVVCKTCLNDVQRLNTLLGRSVDHLVNGGYLLVSYKPIDIELAELKKRSLSFTYPFKYLLHFLWYRGLPKSRVLSRIYFSSPFAWIDKMRTKLGNSQRRCLARAEAYGRLIFYGMEILGEEWDGDHAYLIARKVSEPSTNKTPTYHAIVSLEKVGLNGSIIRLHKVRSMYPFSEFLQKDIYKMHGLTNTGKFKNDFRLTDYGRFIRKYWIDEIPGIFDWLRGDIKLVGMRATSPQFLSLYPRDVVELYLQIKPGLVPPIFDEKTTGFEQIVEKERTYLENYMNDPLKTDLLYFWYTFRDIFLRKVRSK